MNNKDILQRFLFESLPIRGELVHLNESYQTIIHQHDYPGPIKKLLGEALVVVSLLNSIIKYKGRITLQFQSKDKLKLLLAQCTEAFHLRGLVQCDEDISPSEIQTALQTGTLAIIIDPDIEGGKRYQGIVAWQGETLADSIEAYFRISEQLSTRLWIAIDDYTAAGLLLQEMPKETLDQDDWARINYLTETITPQELLYLENEQLLKRLYSDPLRLFQGLEVIFRCTCSLERSKNAIRLLGQYEAEQELMLKQNIVVTCEFCNREYIFDKVDVAVIFKSENPSKLQ